MSGPGTKNLQALGPGLFFIKTLLVNSFLAVIVPQIAFTYVLMYWLLPKFYFKRRNPFVVAVITVCVLLVLNVVAVVFKTAPIFYNKLVGIDNYKINWEVLQRVVIVDQLSSLPIILSFALMIKLVKRWWQKQKQTELLAKEKTKAELQLLKAQVHPHFLFNTLNNIYFFTLTNSKQAPVMIKKLSGMLHYILNECNLPLVPLGKEIKMIRDYMDLEKIRYAEQMQMSIDIKIDHTSKMISPLLLIPFVENSFKHGASKMITKPWVKLSISIENNMLHFMIINSTPPVNEMGVYMDNLPHRQGNIGLKNVRKRLELLYPETHELKIVSEPDKYAVNLSLQLEEMESQPEAKDELKPLHEYAMV